MSVKRVSLSKRAITAGPAFFYQTAMAWRAVVGTERWGGPRSSISFRQITSWHNTAIPAHPGHQNLAAGYCYYVGSSLVVWIRRTCSRAAGLKSCGLIDLHSANGMPPPGPFAAQGSRRKQPGIFEWREWPCCGDAIPQGYCGALTNTLAELTKLDGSFAEVLHKPLAHTSRTWPRIRETTQCCGGQT